MAQSRERGPRERETLIFDTPEEARAWQERVDQKWEGVPQSRRRRELVAQELSKEFAREGEQVELVRMPWEHTQEEHAEVQQLVDVAFERDLQVAIHQARQSPHYPRNLDLLHDVLTGEMYPLMVERGLRRQPLVRWIVMGLLVVTLTLVLIWVTV